MNTEKESRVRVPGFYFLKGGKMKAGDHVKTPRFLTVKIEKVFETEEEARKGSQNPRTTTAKTVTTLSGRASTYTICSLQHTR